MKKITNTRYMLEYISIAFLAYLLLSLVITIIGGYEYREILCSPYQFFGILFIYWWTPVPRMLDLDAQEHA